MKSSDPIRGIRQYWLNNGFIQRDGIWYAQEPALNRKKEELYSAVRNKEGRMYSDTIVRQIPNVDRNTQHAAQWDIRRHSLDRLLARLTTKFSDAVIVDIGCGNGWMANAFAGAGYSVIGVDLNDEELRQASRIFGHHKTLAWMYGDIQLNILPRASVDVIVLASSLQYFNNMPYLFAALFRVLKGNGEIHIIDTPFYSEKEKPLAATRTQEYYRTIGFPDFTGFYHHRTFRELEDYRYKILHNGIGLFFSVKKLFRRPVSPFPWIIVTPQ